MDVFLMEFDVLREEAEARMVTGSGVPDEPASILSKKNTSLPENEKPLALAC